jgi:hypothetical protein
MFKLLRFLYGNCSHASTIQLSALPVHIMNKRNGQLKTCIRCIINPYLLCKFARILFISFFYFFIRPDKCRCILLYAMAVRPTVHLLVSNFVAAMFGRKLKQLNRKVNHNKTIMSLTFHRSMLYV